MPKPVKQIDALSDSGAESDTDNSDVEEKYEKELSERPKKKMRTLLPIKTKDGIEERMEECEGIIRLLFYFCCIISCL